MSAASMSAQEYDGDGRSRLLSQLKPQMSLLDERRLSKTFTVRDITNVMPRPFVFEGYCHDTNSRDFRETPANASCNICDWPQILGALAMIWSMLAVQFTPTRCVPRGSSKSRVRILSPQVRYCKPTRSVSCNRFLAVLLDPETGEKRMSADELPARYRCGFTTVSLVSMRSSLTEGDLFLAMCCSVLLGIALLGRATITPASDVSSL